MDDKPPIVFEGKTPAGAGPEPAPERDAFGSTVSRGPSGRIAFRWDRTTGLCCLALDFACWTALYHAASFLRHGSEIETPSAFSSVALVLFIVLAAALFVIGGYDRRTNFVSLNYMSEHFIAMSGAACLGGVAVYGWTAYGEAISPSRLTLLTSLFAFAVISIAYRRGIYTRLRDGSAGTFYVVLGAGELARTFYRAYRSSPLHQRIRVVDPQPGAPRAGRSIDPECPKAPLVEAIAASHLGLLVANSHGVIVAERKGDLSAGVIHWLTRVHFADTPVYTLDAFYEKYWRIVPVHALDPMWPLEVSSQLASQSVYTHVKRLLDVAGAGLALVLLSPVFALLAILTRADSGTPILFRQTRIGADGAPFTIFKFRTMHNRPVDAPGDLYTQKKDPRITRVGGWLRKLRLDELPQLWNVLKGDMSLMGPRAEWNQLAEGYEREIPFYHFRHLVKPGITGWAQVNYPYGASKEDAIEKLKYDLYYIRHCSLRLDAMIVLKTLHIMLWGKGH